VSTDLRRDLALRLASISKAMGLDDQDEELLWRYVAELEPGQKLDSVIAGLLSNQAEMQPLVVTSCTWKASIPERFYKARQKKMAKLGFRLRDEGEVHLQQPAFVTDLDVYRADLEAALRRTFFEKWFYKIDACLRDDGVNWEPVGEQDVVIETKIVTSSLTAKLAQLM
jgi:hypothetical protein